MEKGKDLFQVLKRVEQISSRNEITALLVEFMEAANINDVQIFAYMLTGRVAPLFVAAEFNFSEKNLLKVLAAVYGERGDVESIRKEVGDIGFTAEKVVDEVFGNSDGVNPVDMYQQLWKVINISGTGSVAAKQEVVTQFISKLSGLEARYFARIIVGKLRLGVSDKTFLDALSVMKVGDKSEREKLDLAYGVNPDLGSIAYEVLTNGIDGLGLEPTPGIPLASRLVERVKSFGEVFERLGDKVLVQPKFDGLRCQVHKGVDYSKLNVSERLWVKYFNERSGSGSIEMFDGGSDGSSSGIKLFSRNLEEMTEMFPEVVEAVESLPAGKVILDCEIVGWNFEKNLYAPFQDTMTRKRKHDIAAAREQVPVKIFPFDIVMLDGKSLLLVDTSERIEQLKKLLKKFNEKVIVMTESKEIEDESGLDLFFEKSVSEGLEGVIVKDLKGSYEPGKRTFEWLKLKKSMKKTLVDSVDVVIMGYYKGSGKRTGFGMGALLGGVYNRATDMIESVTKIGTGINDQQWGEIAVRLKSVESKDMPKQYLVDPVLTPDVWVLPDVVCSVEADEITLSKVHKAARTILGEKGLALRFPRLIEFDRDKRVEDATDSAELVNLSGFKV